MIKLSDKIDRKKHPEEFKMYRNKVTPLIRKSKVKLCRKEIYGGGNKSYNNLWRFMNKKFKNKKLTLNL